MPKISIIIPVYNTEKFIKKCLDSVLSQTFTDLECILVDDGSIDNSGNICDEYLKIDKRIRVIKQKNAGVSAARNAGLDIAHGKWITFIDSDDWVNCNYLELMYNNAINNNCNLSICGVQIVDEKGEIVRKSKQFPIEFYDKNTAKKRLLSANYFLPGIWGKLVNRKYIYDYKISFETEIKIAEDALFWFKVIGNVDKILYDSTPCYNYLINENSATKSPKTFDSNVTAFCSTGKMLEMETNKSVSKKIKSYEAFVAYNMCNILLRSECFVKDKYDFYRKYLCKSFYYYISDSDFEVKSKVFAFLCLFPKTYCKLIKIKHLFM